MTIMTEGPDKTPCPMPAPSNGHPSEKQTIYKRTLTNKTANPITKFQLIKQSYPSNSH
jgi:hypothetical protein